jgi:nucleoside-diphosphate-sugar epimerase
MARMLILGQGYAGGHIAAHLRALGWHVVGTSREGGNGLLRFADIPAVTHAIGTSTHILSAVPPGDPEGGTDPVLAAYGAAIAASPAHWIGYLSSTGVYGDTGGAWVDESAPVGGGRRTARVRADAAWAALREDVRLFRLPGIYGPGRSALERVREGKARRIAVPGQIFSRVHVDDIARGVIASFDAPPGVYNLADDAPCPQNSVIEAACMLLGAPPPPLQPLDEAGLSPQARAFYAENRRIANGKARRCLGWTPAFPTYREGLADCFSRMANTMPTSDRSAPPAASSDQS